MQYKQAKIYFFVAYLGLLINLGPSLHHADFLGFHSHCGSDSGCCHSRHDQHHDAHSHAGHSHAEHASAEGSHCGHSHSASEAVAQLIAVQAGENDHDCVFCKFFEQLHVIVNPIATFEVSDVALIRAIDRPSDVRSAIFIPVARGPPAAV